MIIDFSLTNFHSIRETQKLDLIAVKGAANRIENSKPFNLKGFKNSVVNASAIYGANASGKSNFLKGLCFFSDFITDSYRDIEAGDKIPLEFFELDTRSCNSPSSFEINFILHDKDSGENIRYSYELSLSVDRVLFESLKSYPKGTPQNWYTRIWDDEKNDYDWTPVDGFYDINSDWKKETRDNVTFLSYAMDKNDKQLTPIHKFFKNIHCFNLNGMGGSGRFTSKILIDDSKSSIRVKSFMQHADIGIMDINVSRKEIDKEKFIQDAKDFFAPTIANDIISKLSPASDYEIIYMHKGENGKLFPMKPENESSGTKRLYSLLGPFFDILNQGTVIVYDEIESSLHPLIVVEILKLFLSAEHNPNGAQLIFTTHNPILLDYEIEKDDLSWIKLLNRDQIWFTEKTFDGATKLYSLLEYSPRVGENRSRNYLSGKYGGIPSFDYSNFHDVLKEKASNREQI